MPGSIRLLIALLATLFALSAGAQVPAPQHEDDDDDEAPPAATAPAPPSTERLPLVDLSEPVLFEYLVAEIAAQRGDVTMAVQTLTDLARRTRDLRFARRAVELATRARATDLALRAARLWQELDRASPQALRVLAGILVDAHRVEEAEPHLAKLLASQGAAMADAFLQLRQMLARNPDKMANLRLVRKLTQPFPKLPEARVALAQAALAADDEASGLAELRRAAELRPDWELPVLFEAQVLARRSPQQASERLTRFLERHPKSRDVRLNYARVLVGERRYPEARAEFEKLLELHKDDAEAVHGVGLLAMRAKDYATAEANLRRLLELGYRDPNGVRFTLGQIAEEQREWSRAIEWYQTITRGDHLIAARLRTANAIAKQGSLEQARSYLRGVSAAGEPQRIQLLVAEAQLLREANRHSDAFDLLGAELQKTPDQPELLYDYALTAEKLARLDLLEANLRKLIQMRPDHAHAYNALGYSLADRNERLPEARKLIERALELSPDDYYIIDSMGWVLYRLGDLKGAAQHLRRAWEGRPDAEIGAHLGEVLWAMGERQEAERIWREALQSSPENETLQKTIQRLKQ